jgi:hypothetical protein
MLLGVGLQLFVQSPRRWIFWFNALLFLLLALFFLTLNFGALINRLTADAGILTVRWNTKIFRKHIRIDKITGITEDKRYISIMTDDGRSIRLRVRLLDPDKRRAIRKFLMENTGF